MKSAEIMPVPSQPVVPASAAKVEKAPGIVSETARRFSGNRLSMLGLLVVVVILAAAILADFLAPYPRDHVFFADMLKDPSPAHLLGTDEFGGNGGTSVGYGTGRDGGERHGEPVYAARLAGRATRPAIGAPRA